MKKPGRPVIIPAALLIYLAAMAIMGYPAYRSGVTPALNYFGGIGVTLVIIVALHFLLRRRERLRRERLDDIQKNESNNTQE